MYLLVNPDQTINFADEHPINASLHFEGLKLIEFPEKKLKEVVGNIAPEQAYWDEAKQKVIRDPSLIANHDSTAWKQMLAREKILEFYSLYKQINIIRSDDEEAIKNMSNFIDRCRAWSKDPKSDFSSLNKIKSLV